jgi:hypothetical protein
VIEGYHQWLHDIELNQISAFSSVPIPELTHVLLLESELEVEIVMQLADNGR